MAATTPSYNESYNRSEIKSYLDHPPPQYAEATSPRNSRIKPHVSRNPKTAESVNCNSGPWLLRRTSIVIESEPSELYSDDRSLSRLSTNTSRHEDDKNSSHKQFRNHGHNHSCDSVIAGRRPEAWHDFQQFDTGFGTKVFIEAGKPKRGRETRQHDMKGLEQAASVKRWAGGTCPGEAWGKLMKDPELWDTEGDTLVYFGHQRPQPSFRVRSSMLENVGSEILTQKLQEGKARRSKPASLTESSTSSTSRRGFSKLSLNAAEPGPANVNPDADDPRIRYEIYFPAPNDASRLDILRYHITTRNFLALLLSKPLVGLTFYQALIDLHERLRLYMPGDPNCALIIIKCLMENSLHNVCNDAPAAAGLLAWSEDEEVCWQEGWREGFVHCSGMYAQLQKLPEFRDVSHTSRALLERAHLERQVRLQEAEDRLNNFDFSDMWPESIGHLRTVRDAFDQCRKFLRTYYEKQYRPWPPKTTRDSDGTWLNRAIVSRLQADVDALYDHFVDKDIVWNNSKESQERSQGLVRRSGHSAGNTTDSDSFLAEVFKRFDQKHKYSHIPHPYPLFPAALSSVEDGGRGGSKASSRPSLFGSKSKALGKRVAHAYSEASNLPTLRRVEDFASNAMLEAFVAFEKTTEHPAGTEPRAARMGRWMLLYGLLQVLARVSVDTPDLYFAPAADEVPYFLNPRLKGTPPWSYGSGTVYEEAEPKMAHVWRDFANT